MCRQATNKSLPGPDATLNELIIARIKSGGVNNKEVMDVLRNRLEQKRPHKVYLALNLIQLILFECPGYFQELQQAQLLGEISRYAQRPMDRFSKDLRSGQQAKVLAFEILGNMQGAAKSPHARTVEQGAADTLQHEQFAALTDQRVHSLIARAQSQIELVQEAVLPLSGSDESTVSEGDARFLDASVAALRGYQADLENAVNVLAGQDTEASSALMSECLKAMDALHTTMAFHKEVMEASKKTIALRESPQQQPPVFSETLLPGFDTHDSSSAPDARAGTSVTTPGHQAAAADQSVLKQLGWL
ncbi:g57 [Coccomyxa elongata]